MKLFNKANESGRSMVEMLGVLAIIGVLSVMGIAGYTQAMKAHKANEIANAVSKLYLLGMSANEGNGGKELPYAGVLGTLPTDVSVLTFTAENKITATITDEDVCKKVANMLGDKATGSCSGNSSALTITLGEVKESTVADDDPSTAGFYVGSACSEGDCSNCISYYILENGDYKYIRDYGCPSGYGCNEVITTPTELSSLAEAKESICFKLPKTREECLSENKYWVGRCYDTKEEAQAGSGCLMIWINDHEGECM